jgi:ribosome-associated protein
MTPVKKKFSKGRGGGKSAARKKTAHKHKKGAPKSARPSRKGHLAAVPSPKPPAENPRAKAMAHKIAEVMLDKKGLDVVILDVRGMTSYADYFVIGSGESERQVSAMADAIGEKLKVEDGLSPLGTEGQQTGHWVLLDFGEVVAHLFFTEVRAFYDLEGLWADAPREKVA